MKKLLLTFLIPFSFFVFPVLAQQAPQKFNYQAVAREAEGRPLMGQQVSVRIAIVSGNDMDRPVYAEEHNVTTNKLGLFNLAIGDGEVMEGEFSTIDWGSASHYINVWIDAKNSGNFEELGTSQLLSVPYALYAARSGTTHFEEGETRSDPNDWTIYGNAGTDDATNFIGTTDAQDLVLRADNAEVARFTTDSALQMTSGGRILFGNYNAVNMDGERNIHIGERAGDVSTGNQNAFIGYNAGQVNTTGEKNTFIGPTAGRVNTTGNQNAFIGGRAGFNNTSGSQNAFIGWQAGRDNTTGTQNTFIGKYAGLSNTTGSSNTYIGKDADGSPTLSNATAIGAGATVTQSNSVVLGSGANVGIGTSAPFLDLHVQDSDDVVGIFLDATNDSAFAGLLFRNGSTYTGDFGHNGSDHAANPDAMIMNNYLNSPTLFYTDNTERMRISGDGFVGIGTSSPDTTFHVVGQIKYDDGNQAYGYVLTSDDSGNASWMAASSLAVTSVFDTLNGVVIPGSAVDETTDDFVFGSTQLDYDGNSGHENKFFFDKSKGAFRAGAVTDVNWDADSLGQYSFAVGRNTKASDYYAVATGYQSEASGFISTALGVSTVASGSQSTAIGNYSTASGYKTIAMGNHATASGEKSIAIGDHLTTPSAFEMALGAYNTDYTPNNTEDWDENDRLFTIGNGTSSSEQSDAMVVLKSGEIGIGTSTPDTTLHLVGKLKYQDGSESDGYVLTSDDSGNASWMAASSLAVTSVFDTLGGVVIPGSAVDETTDDFVFGSTQLDDDGIADHRARFFFDKSSSAFRAGTVTGTDWNEANLGAYSFASGYNTLASGNTSTALGRLTTANGNYSTAMGYNTKASGNYSSAIGYYSTASGNYSTAMGRETTASADYSIAMGREATANAANSIAMGLYTEASGSSSSAMGGYSTASGDYSTAMGGETTASGFISTVMGYLSTASGDYSTAMGGNTTASGEISTSMGAETTASGHNSTAMGASSTASGDYSTAMGRSTTASGKYSTALGYYTEAPSGYETVIGRYNTSYTPNSTTGWDTADRLFTIGNGTAGSFSDAFTVLKGGNVGIGTADPQDKLHVMGDVTVESGGGAEINLNNNGQTWQVVSGYSDGLEFGNVTSGDTDDNCFMYIRKTGNVGIGTTTPGYKLEVNGTAAKTGGGSWTATSDRRLKQNINPYSDGLEALMRIRPVTYHYNEKSGYDTAPEYVGVIAQELQEIAPYMVGNFEKDGTEYLNVDNSAMTYMLINAVKELKAENAALKTENASLKTSNEINTDRLNRIEELLQLDRKSQR